MSTTVENGRKKKSRGAKAAAITAGVLGVFVACGVALGGGEGAPDAPPPAASSSVATSTPDPTPTTPERPTKAAEEEVPAEHRAALEKARVYAETMAMSKAAVREQLVSEHGEGFPTAAADYAMRNVEADWKANALRKAEQYQNEMHMSRAAVRDQLTSEHGEGFTKAEADWAMERLK